MKKCKTCLEEKEESQFSIASYYKDKVYRRRDCTFCAGLYKKTEKCKASAKAHRQTDEFKENRKVYRKLDHVKLRESLYQENRHDIRREQHRVRHMYRYNNDVLYKITHLCRVRLNNLLKTKHWQKKTTFLKYIGCTKKELKIHIESKFLPNMTWDNHGTFGWHIDHIIPLDSAQTEQELYKLCHYTNLQPLWAEDNLKKSNKL